MSVNQICQVFRKYLNYGLFFSDIVIRYKVNIEQHPRAGRNTQHVLYEQQARAGRNTL